ncbi:MAG TPA: type II CRISPR RNA-guided endonuclease Cas9 [Ferrovibrio sp.]|uniref:type II CRISPR RNA-guided endonuclease Cas9 n=1 Tax=Ferrovibrio sp. TaxID=1917215 RepID=UPI002ED0846E
MPVPYRLGIDIGTNSLGWCVFDLDRNGKPKSIRRIGVRIFSNGRDPQSGTSLAVDRRMARGARKRRDRFVSRRTDLMKALVRHGLMPTDVAERKILETLDPYELRAKGISERLPPYHLGRAIFHLNQRRGFKSNRKTDKKQKDADLKGMKGGISKLREAMGERTLGQYLYEEFRQGRTVRGSRDGTVKPHATVRARPHVVKGKNEYDLYADRAMYEAEFDRLWQRQTELGANLPDAARVEIRDIIFYQRPLKPVDPGKCALDPTDQRAPLALPLVQRFRMLSELNNLEIVAADQSHRPLTLEERNKLLGMLERRTELSFDKMRAALDLDSSHKFNLEDEKRRGLKGDLTGVTLSKKDCFGPRWWSLRERHDEIVARLLDEPNEDLLIREAMDDWGLSEEAARAVADASLPEGYGRLGCKALAKIVPIMAARVARYHEAAKEAGYDHARMPGEVFESLSFESLPYYGEALPHAVAFGTNEPNDPDEKRHGKIANPTVHIALNEIRKIVNAINEKYGPPAEIVVELARDLPLGKEAKEEKNREQAKNQRENERRRGELAKLGLPDNGENMLRLRLWEELGPVHDRRCVYTGEQISIHRLFSPEVEIEHILPFKRTLDNSPANKTVSLRRANRDKGNNSPHEAFHSRPNYDWEGILNRASSLPKNKRWRFGADAMERFEGERDFLDRQLTDTQYIARLTREYLTKLSGPYNVWVVTGRLTQLLRGKWGLNSLLSDHNQKNRTDHRHHAIDAFVVGLTDRSMLKRIVDAADQNRDRLIDDMPDPWDGFREELKARLDKLVVSHKPDHGIGGKLHEETAYGLIRDPAKEDGATLVYRKPLAGLNENEINRIRDRKLRAEVKAAVASASGNKTDFAKALAAFAEKTGVRHVRLTKVESGTVSLKDRSGKPYKAVSPGDIHRVEIFQLPDGRWAGEGVTVFDANNPLYQAHWRSREAGAHHVMSVHKGDLLKLDGPDPGVFQVHRLDASANRFKLAPHKDGGKLDERHKDSDDSFRWLMISYNQLKRRKARKVTVDYLGRVHDPGPPK